MSCVQSPRKCGPILIPGCLLGGGGDVVIQGGHLMMRYRISGVNLSFVIQTHLGLELICDKNRGQNEITGFLLIQCRHTSSWCPNFFSCVLLASAHLFQII